MKTGKTFSAPYWSLLPFCIPTWALQLQFAKEGSFSNEMIHRALEPLGLKNLNIHNVREGLKGSSLYSSSFPGSECFKTAATYQSTKLVMDFLKKIFVTSLKKKTRSLFALFFF